MSAVAEGHQRRSSLSEALEMRHGHPDHALAIAVPSKEGSFELAKPPDTPFLEETPSRGSSQMDATVTSLGSDIISDLTISTRKTGIVEAEQSPFTPDNPVYELCAEQVPPLSTRKSSVSSGPSTLGTVPEDSPPAPEHLQLPPIDTAAFLSPDKMKLRQVKTPRKSVDNGASNPFSTDATQQALGNIEQPDSDPDRAQRIQLQSAKSDAASVSSCVFKQPSMTFNPFDMEREPMSREGTGSKSFDDDFFAMDFSSQQSQGEAGTSLDPLDVSRGSMDKPEEVHPSPREILGQLLAAVETIINEIDDSHQAQQARTLKTKERSEHIARLQSDLDVLKNEEADMGARLRVIHSQLEAHMLSNLEQEDELRVSGEQLRSVKDEINGLDVALSAAEEQRRELERQLAVTKANKQAPSEVTQDASVDTEDHDSIKSTYSSAWETSESETETYLDTESHRPRRRTLSEDNQAKMSQQGAKGGSWLREILRHRSRKDELPSPIRAEDEDTSTPKGGGMSHFQLPATAAELEKSASEDLAGKPAPTPADTAS